MPEPGIIVADVTAGTIQRRELTEAEKEQRTLDRQRAQAEAEAEKERQERVEKARQTLRDFARADDELAKALAVLLLGEEMEPEEAR